MSAPRVILHVDMDAFFVSVELRRRPELVGKPVVVGGAGARGVVAAASYEARRFGVRSAIPSTTARRLCPDLVFLQGDHDLYGRVSAEVHEIFRSVTPTIEPLALDEAFLDVTGSQRLLGPGAQIAQLVRDRVHDELALACSVGVAPNKFLAKLASVAAKPRVGVTGIEPGAGVVEVRPGEELAFLHPLPVQALWGVGPATLERLQGLGVRTVAQLAELDEAALIAVIGKAHGSHLHRLAWAIDDRPVEVDRALKSIGHEETFSTDRHTHAELRAELVRLADAVAGRLRAHGGGARTVSVKVRFGTFETITRSTTLSAAVGSAHAIIAAAEPMLQAIDPGPGVRLLGVSVSNFADQAEQLTMDSLFDEPGRRAQQSGAQDVGRDWQLAEETMDAIRERFGATAIGPASAVSTSGLRVVRRGAQQWGPAADE